MADVEFSEVHYRETVDLTGARLQNALFRNCVITGLRKALLLDCELPGCELRIDSPLDFLDATVTLNCWTFRDVRLSETAFDALIYLVSLGAGNDRKRAALRELIEPSRMRLFDRVFPEIGTR